MWATLCQMLDFVSRVMCRSRCSDARGRLEAVMKQHRVVEVDVETLPHGIGKVERCERSEEFYRKRAVLPDKGGMPMTKK